MPETSGRLIGVIGGSQCSGDISRIAEAVGRGIAHRGDILVCGGLGGVMEAACKGAKLQGGLTLGILPGGDRLSANRYVDIPIVSGLGHARNLIIVQSSHGIVALAGGYGTLSEIAFASLLEVPIVGIRTWGIEAPILRAESAEEALERLYSKI
jgi:uncharacterized protein (TIGR00725 family)